MQQKPGTKQYKCVNCGEPANALYKTYGPSVLKVNKCTYCNGIVDKYIEYDPAIVMIDLVLMSKEAQRHVIYNTDFKAYWKLLIVLMLLETYGVWRNDSLFNIAINSLCDIKTNSTVNTTYLDIPIRMPEVWRLQCDGWVPEQRGDESDLFIWEKDFYIHFMATFTGISIFILTIHGVMSFILRSYRRNEASFIKLLKAYALANMSLLFTLPMLVWGTTETTPQTRALHYSLVFAYSFVVFFNVFTVLYECPVTMTSLVLALSHCAKYAVTFHTTPILRIFIT